MRFAVQLVILHLALHCTNAKRLKLRVDELERVLEEQRLVNQQQTLIILELVKVRILNLSHTVTTSQKRQPISTSMMCNSRGIAALTSSASPETFSHF